MMSNEDRFALADADMAQDQAQVQRLSSLKTVETFAGITKRRLWLTNSTIPHTDGYEISVPLADPAAYKLVGHQLAHILFQSNPHARKLFVEEYTKRVAAQTEKNGEALQDFQKEAFSQLLHDVLNSVECHRVESLWGLLYSGSYKFGRTMAREDAEAKLADAHATFGTYLGVLEAGCDPPSGRFDRFRPYIVEAFRKAERRGPNATFVVGKWLITHLVSEILREARDEPPPPGMDGQLPDLDGEATPSGGEPKPKDDSDEQDPNQSDQQEKPDPAGLQADPELEGESVGNAGEADVPDGAQPKDTGGSEGPGKKDENGPTDAKASGQSDEVGEPDDSEEPGSGKWSPPKTDASQKERAQALKDFINRSVPNTKAKQPPSRFDDVREPPAPEKGAAQAAAEMVSEALKADVHDGKELGNALDASRNQMERRLQEARNAFRQQMTHDEWLRKDTHAKVVFRDVRARDAVGLQPDSLSAEDLATVQKLRAIFNRVMGRRRVALEESGFEVDTMAAIERRVTGQNVPIFKHDVRGQGFKPLILIDRSGSMYGSKQEQSERACRIISRALRYPFVDLHVWGFNSLANGQVDIVRFDPRVEVFETDKSKIAGSTPFHLAIRVAHRFLERGSEMKHLFAVTDGFPVYTRGDGKSYDTRQLLLLVRDEVTEARRRSISTTGAIVGSGSSAYSDEASVYYDLGPRELRFMFGAPRFWKQIDPRNFGNDLVKLVASSFLDYLNRA